jgi:hypothetical protein
MNQSKKSLVAADRLLHNYNEVMQSMSTQVLTEPPVMPTVKDGQRFAMRVLMAIAAGIFIWCGLIWSISGS